MEKKTLGFSFSLKKIKSLKIKKKSDFQTTLALISLSFMHKKPRNENTGSKCEAPLPKGGNCKNPVPKEGDKCHYHGGRRDETPASRKKRSKNTRISKKVPKKPKKNRNEDSDDEHEVQKEPAVIIVNILKIIIFGAKNNKFEIQKNETPEKTPVTPISNPKTAEEKGKEEKDGNDQNKETAENTIQEIVTQALTTLVCFSFLFLFKLTKKKEGNVF